SPAALQGRLQDAVEITILLQCGELLPLRGRQAIEDHQLIGRMGAEDEREERHGERGSGQGAASRRLCSRAWSAASSAAWRSGRCGQSWRLLRMSLCSQPFVLAPAQQV